MCRFLIALFFSLPAIACETDVYFPCSASLSHYAISVDAVQTTFAKSNIHITIGQDKPDGLVHIKNNTPFPLYTVTNQRDAEAPSFSLGGKNWYVQARFTNTGDTYCTPGSATRDFLRNLERTEWDCKPRELCGTTSNSNEAVVPAEGYPREWLASGVTSDPLQLPKQRGFSDAQYFLYNGELRKLSLKSLISLNEEYLRVTCDANAKVEACGKDCAVFISDPKKADAVTSWSSVKAPVTGAGLPELFEMELSAPQENIGAVSQWREDFAQSAASTLRETRQQANLEKLPMEFLVYQITLKGLPIVHATLDTLPLKIKLQRNRNPSQAD